MKTLNISEETYEKIKDQLLQDEVIDINSFADLVGKKLFFRTVTYHSMGEVVKVIGNFLELKTASWIPDTGRFMQFLKDGKLDEVEPAGTMFINLSSVVDFHPWNHTLPTEQK